MYKALLNILILPFLIVLVIPARAAPQKESKSIVIFYSRNPGFLTYDYINDGFTSSFNKESGNNNVLPEYLDIIRSQNQSYGESVVKLYNEKFKSDSIALIILIGPGTYSFLERNGLKALKNTPVISLDNIPLKTQTGHDISNDSILEIVPKYDYHNIVKSMLDIFPDFREVYLISGCNANDNFHRINFIENIKDFRNTHNFTEITGISFDSTLKRVSQIPQNSIIIVNSYTEDANNVTFITSEVISSISRISRAPVFTVSDASLNKGGAIGGYVFSFKAVGTELGKAANQILAGIDPKSIKVSQSGFHKYIFNWEELKRWDLLDSKAIPRDSIFLYQDISFFAKYKWYGLGLLLFLVFQTSLILYLIKWNRIHKKVKNQTLEAGSVYYKLVREDRLSKMTELTASLSHELNQPLTAILYNAQAGKRFLESDKLDRKQAEEIFNNIIADDKRAGGIISSVRSLMKLEIREKEKIVVNSLVTETIDIVRNDIIRHGIKITTEIDESPVLIFADKIQLQQVLLNFLRNSMDALERINSDDKKIEVTMKPVKDTVTVSVRDTGPGIDKDIFGKVFNPFVTTGKTGFGIGLAVSRSIIENHDGKIWAENIPGGGAEFSFRLKIIKNG